MPDNSPTAAFKIDINGTEFTQASSGSLESLIVETHLDKIGRAELVLSGDSDTQPRDLNLGDEIKVSIGGDARQALHGTITHLSHVHQQGVDSVRIVAMDPLIKLAASNVTKVYEEQSDSDIASAVIGDAGATAGTVDSTSEVRPYVLQRAESNLRFLKRLAARNGYLVYAEENTVHFKKPQFSDDPIEVDQELWIKLEMTKSDAGVPQKVVVYGWNYTDKIGVSGELASTAIETIGGGAAPSSVTWTGDHQVVDVFVNSDAAAATMAKGLMNQLARQLVQGSCTVKQDGRFYPGVKVKFSGSYQGYNAEGVVVGVRHVVETGGVASTTFWFVGNTTPE
jgi:phage protein D